jgi:protein-L-isoaspartate(D-aspartate) O-methyltransferase
LSPDNAFDPARARAYMVQRQLRARGITDERVLAAMGSVPRERFVASELREQAYEDGALAIGHGQTISQPWVVAAICQGLELTGTERVLDVGAGSGYSSAVLAELAREVLAVELIGALARRARRVLAELGYENVEVREGDASAGVPGEEPFDAIAVHAAAPRVPAGLVAQLRPGGRLVVPIASDGADMLTAFRRVDEGSEHPMLERYVIAPCRFVPLLGAGGYSG